MTLELKTGQVAAAAPGQSHVVAFMDIGTNSVRLLLVRVTPSHSYSVLSQQKEVVRLGGGEFPQNHLQADAMDRAALVCSKFAQMARSFGAAEILAVATSATRDADNQSKFVRLLQKQAGIDVHVISGREEARLIYLGVSSGLDLGNRHALFIDIGGGSTEIILGDQGQYLYLDSLKLGSIRLTNMFFAPDETGPVSRSRYQQIQQYVANAAVLTEGHLKSERIDLAVGSSGTIMNLCEIAVRESQGRPLVRDELVCRDDLKATIRKLCSLSLAQRRRVPGINPERADIIIAGAAILETLMDHLNLREILVSDRGLREGMLAHYLSREQQAGLLEQMSVRERSVMLLGRACNFEEGHACDVAALSMELFDSAKACGLLTSDGAQRELLYYAALLHDIGVFLSFVNHQDHTFYLIRNSDLLGFDQTEIAIMAAIARFHRKGFPKKKSPESACLDKPAIRVVRRLSALLRLAESLDRTHAGLVRSVRLVNEDAQVVRLEIDCPGDCHLELWGVKNHRKYFKRAFGRRLVVPEPRPGP